ncbi:MAG: chromate resistance protein [Nitrospirae bacterium]|nr:chromate resistance protein [Nitrospirota bacterium]
MMKISSQEWLLIFYSVPAHPVSGRMRIWRRLAKAGAVPLKGAVYILPANDENRELFQWIIGEVKSLGGDGSFVQTSRIETLTDSEVRELFRAQRDTEYRDLAKSIDSLERKVLSGRKGAVAGMRDSATGILATLRKTYDEIHSRDFFDAFAGKDLEKRIRAIESELKEVKDSGPEKLSPLTRKDPKAYQQKVWVTRKRPFIDRMASAWLIRRFIDRAAKFRFIDEKDILSLAKGEVAFDIQGGEFTHHGELCTFEVFVRSFGIKDRAVRKIAEIVHDLDVKDDRYGNSAGSGIEEILTGIRKTVKEDTDMLEKGMAVFEMMYQSRT